MQRTVNRALLDVLWLSVVGLAVNITAHMEVHGVTAEDLLTHLVELDALNVNVGEALDDL